MLPYQIRITRVLALMRSNAFRRINCQLNTVIIYIKHGDRTS